jgi:hypothetical protein
MIPNHEISIISLYSNDDSYHTFSVIPKKNDNNYLYDKINIIARNGLIITMGGDTQN